MTGIRQHLLLTFGILSLLISLSLTSVWLFGVPWLDIEGMREVKRHEATTLLAGHANDARRVVTGWIRERRSDITLAAANPFLQAELSRGSGNWSKIASTLVAIVDSGPEIYERIDVVDGKGRLLVSTVAAPLPAEISGHLPEFMAVGIVESLTTLSVDRQSRIVISRQILDPADEGRILGLVVAVLNPDAIISQILDVTTGESGNASRLMLANQAGAILAEKSFSAVPEGIDEVMLRHAVQMSDAIFDETTSRGKRLLILTRFVPVNVDEGWSMVFALDYDAVMAPLLSSLIRSCLTSLLLTLFGLMAVYCIAVRMSRPLIALRCASEELQQGNLQARADVPSYASAEYRQLARTFNAMAEKVMNWHRDMDAAIHLRTEELRQSETKLNLVLDNVGAYVFMKDARYRYTYANKKTQELFGKSAAEIVGLGDDAFFDAASVVEISSSDRPVIEEGKSVAREENDINALDGRRRSYWSVKLPLRDAAGNVVGLCGIATDVTERREAEILLRESEERYEELVDRLGSGVGVYLPVENGTRFVIRQMNSTGKRFSGAGDKEIVGKYLDEVFPTIEAMGFQEILRKVNETNQPLHLPELEYRSADFSAWFENYVYKLSSGEIVAVFTDITERKQLEDDYRVMIRTSKDGFWIMDRTGTVIDVNDAYCHMSGYRREEVLGKRISDFDVPGSPEIAAEMMERVMEVGFVRFESKQRDKGGRVFDVEISASYLKERQSFCVFIRDIGERKQAEAENRSLSDMLQESQHIAHIGGWEIDLATNALHWSHETYLIHETNPEEYAPDLQSAIAFYAPESIPVIENAVRNAIDNGTPFQLELDLITAKGRRIRVYATSKVIREGGVTTKIMGAFQDVTELRKLEEQLRQSLKMESVGRLAGGVAHDFNNMLSVILGHSEMGLMELEPGDPIHARMKEIRDASERSAELTRQLLAFARKQTVVPKELELNETIASMLKMLQRLIGEDIRIAWQPAPGLWRVKIDPSQIDQILANLCVNARDAIKDTGMIAIETRNCTVDADYCLSNQDATPGDYVLFSVSDNGVGMDRETLSHIFEPFYTTKGFGHGTGLGLATVYGAVRQNSGFVNVYSESGRGTTFSIYLPRHRAAGTEPVAATETAAAPGGKETILLVEDEPSILLIASTLLKRQGYGVLAAGTATDALQAARQCEGEIHLLMTDVIMPDMNGSDLANLLLSSHPRMKVLFMSGYTADVIAHHGVLDEGVYFIQKPFSMQTLAAKVREVLDGGG